MARVVQRRSNPPYLLIIFVFLFLVATTIAVLQTMEADRLEKELASLEETSESIVDSTDLQRPTVQELQRQVDATGNTVLAQLVNRSERLAERIDPRIGGYEEAQAALDKLSRRLQSAAREQGLDVSIQNGLIPTITGLFSTVVEKKAQVAELESQIDSLNGEIQAKQDTVTSLREKNAETAEDLQQQIAQINQKLTQREQDHRTQLRQAEQEFAQARSDLENNIAQKTQRIDELMLEMQRKDAQLDKLQTYVAELKRRRIPQDVAEGEQPEGHVAPVNPARMPDGKILRVIEDSDVCYINLGQQDRVMPGLTFSVYSTTGIPYNGEGKGSIIVTSVSEAVAEARMVEQAEDNPIISGDLIGNLAFDALRRNTFVVEGVFDIYGTGQATMEGAREVEDLIKRFGGTVTGEVSIQTDFVVMGQEPAKPKRPSEDAPQQTFAIYESKLRAYERYGEVSSLAQSLGIPIFKTSRFLAFMGYNPTQPIEY